MRQEVKVMNLQRKKREVQALKQYFEALKKSKAEYHDSLQGMSDDLHPLYLL